MLDLAIRGGDVVVPHGIGRWSVGVKDGKIAFVGLEDQAIQAAKVIDATGKLVVPGGIAALPRLARSGRQSRAQRDSLAERDEFEPSVPIVQPPTSSPACRRGRCR